MATTERAVPDTTIEDDESPPGTVSRRSALKVAGLGLGTVTVAGGIGVGLRAGTNGAFTAGDGDAYELWSQWPSLTGVQRVVAAGVLACNPHNTQPWLLDVSPDGILVSSDPTRRMPLNDAGGREHFAGLGCAVENMVVAASALGLAPAVEVFPSPGQPDLVARIRLGSGAARDRSLSDAIPRRHTNRGPYTPEPVRAPVLSALAAQTALVRGTGLVWVTDPGARSRLGDLYVEATRAITADEAQSQEAFAWFRNDRSDIDEHRDGLTLDGQGLGALTLFAAKVLPAQSRPDGDAFWLKATREVHTATAAAYGVITVGDVHDRSAQVAGGRLLARLHLAATALGLGFHHMNQITERIDRDAAAGRADVFSARWSELLGRPADQGLVSFRIGHPERFAARSPRRALSDVVTT